MGLNVDRRSLNERILDLEKTKMLKAGNAASIDFDQYPETCVKLLPEGFLFKFSVDNLGDYGLWDGLGIKICVYSPRINGLLFNHIEILSCLVVSKSINFSLPLSFPVPYPSFYFVPDCKKEFEKERMLPAFHSLAGFFGYAITFGAPILARVFTSVNGPATTQINRGFSLDCVSGHISIVPPQGVGSPGTVYPSTGYNKSVFRRMPGLSNSNFFRPEYLEELRSFNKTVASGSVLDSRFKWLFPASWSV